VCRRVMSLPSSRHWEEEPRTRSEPRRAVDSSRRGRGEALCVRCQAIVFQAGNREVSVDRSVGSRPVDSVTMMPAKVMCGVDGRPRMLDRQASGAFRCLGAL
jgi:hypothetical protein